MIKERALLPACTSPTKICGQGRCRCRCQILDIDIVSIENLCQLWSNYCYDMWTHFQKFLGVHMEELANMVVCQGSSVRLMLCFLPQQVTSDCRDVCQSWWGFVLRSRFGALTMLIKLSGYSKSLYEVKSLFLFCTIASIGIRYSFHSQERLVLSLSCSCKPSNSRISKVKAVQFVLSVPCVSDCDSFTYFIQCSRNIVLVARFLETFDWTRKWL